VMRKYRVFVRLTLEWSGELEADTAAEAIRDAKMLARARPGDDVDAEVKLHGTYSEIREEEKWRVKN